jgi:heme oxygenase (mycobilin-producing)
MAIKVLIKRRIPEGFINPKFNSLIQKLRTLAIVRDGYISGETLKRADQPREYLVISTWKNTDAWNAWRTSPERTEIQGQIDAMLETQTEYGVYEYR